MRRPRLLGGRVPVTLRRVFSPQILCLLALWNDRLYSSIQPCNQPPTYTLFYRRESHLHDDHKLFTIFMGDDRYEGQLNAARGKDLVVNKWFRLVSAYGSWPQDGGLPCIAVAMDGREDECPRGIKIFPLNMCAGSCNSSNMSSHCPDSDENWCRRQSSSSCSALLVLDKVITMQQILWATAFITFLCRGKKHKTTKKLKEGKRVSL